MLRRLFKSNRLFSALFLFSFFVSFIVMYYGLNLNRQLIQISVVREGSEYEYGHMISGSISEDTVSADDIRDEMMSDGNMIFRCSGPIGEDVINVSLIDILWVQNEALAEAVKYEDYYLDSAVSAIAAPKCIIGDAWEDETYVVDGIRYIKLFKIESCVIGEFVSNTLPGLDERCVVLKESLSREELDKLVFGTDSIRVIYESNLSDEIDWFREWTRTFLTEESFREDEIDRIDLWNTTEKLSFIMFMTLYKKIYIGMLILCFINCAFLAYFWGKTHFYEYMLKRTLGFGKLRLFMDITAQFALYAVISLGTALLLTCGYELLCGNIVKWCENLRLGFGQLVLVFVIFGVALSALPMWLVVRLKPAEILKNAD